MSWHSKLLPVCRRCVRCCQAAPLRCGCASHRWCGLPLASGVRARSSSALDASGGGAADISPIRARDATADRSSGPCDQRSLPATRHAPVQASESRTRRIRCDTPARPIPALVDWVLMTYVGVARDPRTRSPTRTYGGVSRRRLRRARGSRPTWRRSTRSRPPPASTPGRSANSSDGCGTRTRVGSLSPDRSLADGDLGSALA